MTRILTEQEIEAIRNNPDDMDWNVISQCELTIPFAHEFRDKLVWDTVSRQHRLGEEFIRRFADCLQWNLICGYQVMSEDFMREMKDFLKWWWVSKYQTLSYDFIREFAGEVRWNLILENQRHLNKKILKKMKKDYQLVLEVHEEQ